MEFIVGFVLGLVVGSAITLGWMLIEPNPPYDGETQDKSEAD